MLATASDTPSKPAVAPAPVPDWVIDAVERGRPAANGTSDGSSQVAITNGTSTDSIDYVSVDIGEPLRGLAAVPAIIRGPRPDSGGKRHDVLVDYACSLRARSVPYDEAGLRLQGDLAAL